MALRGFVLVGPWMCECGMHLKVYREASPDKSRENHVCCPKCSEIKALETPSVWRYCFDGAQWVEF